jgi:hypothetical protein
VFITNNPPLEKVEPNLLLIKVEQKKIEDLAQPFSKVEKVEKVVFIETNLKTSQHMKI